MMLYALLAVFIVLLLLYLMPIVVSLDISKNNEDDRITMGLNTLYGLLKLKSEIPFLIITFENGKPALKYKVELPNRKRSKLMARFTKLFTVKEGEGLYKKFKNSKHMIMPILKYLRRKTEIIDLRMKVGVGTGDAAATGVLYGIVWILIGNVMTLVRSKLKVDEATIAVIPIFNKILLSIDFNCIISIKLGHIINAGIRALPAFMSGMKN